MQQVVASAYRGKRVRLSAVTRAEKVDRQATIGLGVDDFELGNQPISGTTGWTQQSIVVDIPSDADVIMLGAVLDGPGTLWLSGIDFREVGRSTPAGEPASPGNVHQ